MKGILADRNIEKHVEVLVGVLSNGNLSEFWDELGLSLAFFATLGLPEEMSDRFLWHFCQENEWLLITGNRNRDGPNSLEAVLLENRSTRYLPVFTLGDMGRVLADPQYRIQAAEDLLEYLFDIETLRGTGRLYLPRQLNR